MYTLFIFRRDLRLPDNLGFIHTISSHENVIPIFIFNPAQVSSKNSYKSDNAVHFMIESLQDLDRSFKKIGASLRIFYGDDVKVLRKINKVAPLSAIVFNEDYTPYARSRDADIAKYCNANGIDCIAMHDYLLRPMGELLKSDGDPYSVYTPFYRNALLLGVDKPQRISAAQGKKAIASTPKGLPALETTFSHVLKNLQSSPDRLVSGGRTAALKQLSSVTRGKPLSDYSDTRDHLSESTTELSAHIKFGCLSIREVYHKLASTYGKKSQLIAQLYWREFYFYITYYTPSVLDGQIYSTKRNANYNDKYDALSWSNPGASFDAWCNGMTGYPVVDAGMRQLNATGYMHNRARLITANFLNRMLNIDWRHGEQYYAVRLTDYDPAVNNGNWQWIASTGADPKPYFQRLFNPWLQSSKFDPDGTYIKTWVPELADVPAAHLHKWDKHAREHDVDYPDPIVDYKTARERSKKNYQKAIK